MTAHSEDSKSGNMLLLLLLMISGVCGSAVKAPFRVTRVENEVVGDVFRTKVMFQGPPSPTILLGDDKLRTREPSAPGVLEFDTTTARRHETVTFVQPDQQYQVTLSLSEDARSMDVPAVLHSVQPSDDIQLQPDQPLNVAFAVAVEGIGNGTLEPSRVEVLLPSSTEDNTIYRYKTFNHHLSERFPYREDDHLPVDLDQKVEEEVVDGSSQHQHRTVTMLTPKAGWQLRAGVVKLTSSLYFSCYDNCLVAHVLDTRFVRFYPQGEAGPFPGGFLGFVRDAPEDSDDSSSSSSSSSHHTPCPVNSNFDDCNIVCEVMGDGVLTSVDVTRMTPSASSSEEDELSVVSGGWGKSVVHVSDVSFEDAGEFRCTARSLAGSEASETLSLGVLQSVRIDREASAFSFTNQADGTKVFTCVANGVPAPSISFVDYTESPLRRYTPSVTHPTQSQTRAQVAIKVANPQSDTVGVFCEAKNDDGSGSSFGDTYFYRG